jgi:hypothetical protein
MDGSQEPRIRLQIPPPSTFLHPVNPAHIKIRFAFTPRGATPAAAFAPTMDTLPNLSLGTAALAIFALCAIYVMLRGISRVLVGTAILGISAWLGFLTWQAAPGLSVDWFGKSIGLITTAMPIAVFVITFIAIRLVLRWVTSPFGDYADKLPEKKGLSLFKLVIALIPTLILLAIGIGFVHHSASVQELRDFAKKTQSADPKAKPPFLQTLKVSIEKTVPQDWLKTLDPLADKSRLAVAKWVTTQSNPQPDPKIDSTTGKPIPRAIIVDNPVLQELAREQKFGTLLRHPIITKALEDPKVRKLIKDLNL